MPANRARRYRILRPSTQTCSTADAASRVVHDQHDQIHVFNTDLQSPTSSTNRDKRRSAPATFRAAGRHSASMLSAKHKAPFTRSGTTRTHFAPLALLPGFLVRCRHNRMENVHRLLQAITESSRADPAQAKVPAKPIKLINNTVINFFMDLFLWIWSAKRRISDGLT